MASIKFDRGFYPGFMKFLKLLRVEDLVKDLYCFTAREPIQLLEISILKHR